MSLVMSEVKQADRHPYCAFVLCAW